MNLLVVIGAGASFDCWPEYTHTNPTYQKLPLANELFSSLPVQNSLLQQYELMGLASTLRYSLKIQGKNFDIEKELAELKKKNDLNMLQSLFKAKFFLHGIITILTERTLSYTHSHTVYVDLLNHLKNWIDGSPTTRFVDMVVFNYDNLIEDAMKQVYNYDWFSKNKQTPLSAYHRGKNLKIYKPHGSINWGRELFKNDSNFSYYSAEEVFHEFNQVEISNSFQFINPKSIFETSVSKNFIPAIAVPFKEKNNFEECPQEMQVEMLKAVNRANKILTFGWKGTDTNFTSLLKSNSKPNEVYVINPSGKTNLDKIFSTEIIKRYESTFRYFVSDTSALQDLLNTFNEK